MSELKPSVSANAGGTGLGSVLLALGLTMRFATEGNLDIAGATINAHVAGDLFIAVSLMAFLALAGIGVVAGLLALIIGGILGANSTIKRRRFRKAQAARLEANRKKRAEFLGGDGRPRS